MLSIAIKIENYTAALLMVNTTSMCTLRRNIMELSWKTL